MDIAILIRIARSMATAHSLDQALVCAVCDHESRWDEWAVRFEPAFEKKYIAPMVPKLPPTEDMTRSMSFGLMQIMGETAREFGLQSNYLTELCDPLVGLEYGCRKLARCMERAKNNVRLALLYYNGGSNEGYPDAVMGLMEKYETVSQSSSTEKSNA